MARIEQQDVENILLDQYDDDAEDDLTPFIDAASSLVDALCAPLAYTEEHLIKIETWLAAHFYKVVKRQEIREEVGAVRVTYEGKVDLRLQVTEFGQQALVLDYLGGLSKANNAANKPRVQVGLSYLGTDPCA